MATMIKIEDSPQMAAAIARCKAVKPRVRRLDANTVEVTGRGSVYTVKTASPREGLRLACCDCQAGQAGQLCYHVVAALSAPAAPPAPVPPPPANELIITRTPRGYRIEFPHRPNESAIRGFHQLGMVWQKSLERVTWSIPASKLNDAIECIKYWYELPVRVEGGAPQDEQEAAVLVKARPKEYRVEGWMV